ncbi:MAG: CAP domain-containing protein [bacterium]
MKKFQLFALLFLTYFIFYSCSEDTTAPKKGCDFLIDSRLAYLYDCPPSIDNCYEGTLTYAEKMKALDRLNFIRAIHGLPEVGYNPDKDIAVQKSAIIAVANKTLTHYPDSTFKCYTKIGDTACGQSNLHISYYSSLSTVWSSAASIDGWINEKYSTSIGHRRWFLSPFLKNVAFGRVDWITAKGEYWIGSTMWVWDNDGPTESNVEYIACPYHDYPSSALDTNLFLSFSVLMNKSNWWSNDKVDFSTATIQVNDDNQTTYSVLNISSDNLFSGLPNNLQWKVSNLKRNTRYNITISNVDVNGQKKNYEYWFRIVN